MAAALQAIEMNRALLKLLKLRAGGALRRSVRGVKTVRGAIFFLLGLAAVLMWLGPQVMMALVNAGQPRVDQQVLRDVLPLGMLGMVLMSILGATRVEGIHFTAAEVDFLFSGPFSRRQLLVYKLSSGVLAWLFGSLLFSIMLMRYANHWVAAFVGLFLAMAFMQLLTTAIVLAGQSLAEKFYTGARKIALAAVIGLAAIAVAWWLPALFERGFLETAHSVRQSAAWFWLMLPLEPFVRTIAAERIAPDMIGWALAAAGVDIALLAAVIRIDVNFLEGSMVASQKRYLMLQRRRSTGRVTVKPKLGLRIPPLPWLGGAGPIAWRQLITALRGIHGLLFLFFIVACVSLAAVAQSMAPPLAQKQNASGSAGLMLVQISVLTTMLTRVIAFDFRGDLDYMDWAKSLPLKPAAIVLGQLATPVLLMTGIHVLLFSAAAVFLHGSRGIFLAGMLFSPLFNFLLFGIDNLLFLLFPFRAVAATPGDFQHVGRTMVEVFAKMILLALVCGAAAALGWGAYWIGGNSWAAALATSWLAMAGCCLAVVPCVAWAFRRYDVATDTPA